MRGNAITTQQDELVSDEIKDIISHKPQWMIRKGNMIFLLVLLCLFGLTFLVRYPDVIPASTRLVAINPPKLIAAKVEGKIMKLFVANEQLVKKGEHLGYMESTAEFNAVVRLKAWIEQVIDSTQQGQYNILLQHDPKAFSHLGELQTSYQGFQDQLMQAKEVLAGGYYRRKASFLQKDLTYLSSLKKNIQQQQEIQEQDKQLQETELRAYEQLAKDKVIAPLELNQHKSRLLAKEQGAGQVNTELTNNEFTSHNKKKEILDLQKTVADQEQQFRSSVLQLKSEIEKWISQYVLIAPEDGRILFVSSLQENELIANGQSLFYIEPLQTKFYAELMAPQKGFGKVKRGQRVVIRVESYPSSEFGHLTGTIEFISKIPVRHDSFLVRVQLPKGLTTNYGKVLYFRNNLLAQAAIITDDRRLFDRLAGRLREIVSAP
ncbi:MAG TPA: HlyD family efflux transporter periplasmic adaptor subunit [Chitinophagaceae bacterium]|nr:HlyD family efflux transporter periplasmic adaptor subunit [Chitinophagaceae bacterium]